MFVQVIEAQVRDAGALQREWERWLDELAPDAPGWLGSTGGVTADGRFIAAVRFDSAANAQANSARPEQGAWWEAAAQSLDDATFAESTDYRALGGGGDDAAGFVQLMHARISDRERLEALENEMEASWAALRPDLLGGYRLWLPGGEALAVDYFTSEADARAGEAKALPDDMAERFKQWQALATDVRWYDLPDPWLASA